MPFRSESQRRLFFAKSKEPGSGITKKTVDAWNAETPKGKKLPKYVGEHKLVDLLRDLRYTVEWASKEKKTGPGICRGECQGLGFYPKQDKGQHKFVECEDCGGTGFSEMPTR